MLWLVHTAKVFVTLGVLIALVLTLAPVFENLSWIVHLLVHYPPQLAAVALLLLLAALALRMPFAFIVATVCLVAQLPVLTWMFLPPAESTTEGSTRPLVVTTFNMHRENIPPDRLASFAAEVDPDLLVLQSFHHLTDDYIALLSRDRPYTNASAHYGHQDRVIFSKYPLADERRVSITDSTGYRIMRVELPERTLVLMAVHPPNPSNHAGFFQRNLSYERFAEVAAAHPGTILIAGDFNSSPWTRTFKTLLRNSGLKAAEKGQGLAGTWPAFFGRFGIPIDHILVPPGVEVSKIAVGPDLGSMHRPLTAWLRWPTASAPVN